jgi:hypothetical protein
MKSIGIGKDFLNRTPAAQQLRKGWMNGTAYNQKSSAEQN